MCSSHWQNAHLPVQTCVAGDSTLLLNSPSNFRFAFCLGLLQLRGLVFWFVGWAWSRVASPSKLFQIVCIPREAGGLSGRILRLLVRIECVGEMSLYFLYPWMDSVVSDLKE